MKSASAAMDTLLATGGPFYMADLYTIQTVFGSTFAFTDADVNLTVGAATFLANGPVLSRERTSSVLGLESSTMNIVLSADSNVAIVNFAGQSLPWLTAIQQGFLDGATITVDRLIAPSWTDTSAGSINMFVGEVRDISISTLSANINVVSLAYKFDMPLPKNTYSPSCSNTLFDSKCTANKASFSVAKTVTATSTNFKIYTDVIAGASVARWSNGTITFTSGVNNGLSRTVKIASGTLVFDVSLPFPVPPSIGDTFTVTAGCDKTASVCDGRFGNLANFRGFPYVPNPEALT